MFGSLVLFGPKIINNINAGKDVIPSGSSTPQPSTTQVFNIVIANNKISAGSAQWTVLQGDTVIVNIVSDKDSTFMLEGYQKSIALKKNQNVTLQFIADKSGYFPFEMQDTGTNLGALTVNPK